MKCPICGGRHECPDPHYTKVQEAIRMMGKLGIHPFAEHNGSVSINLTLTADAERLAGYALMWRQDLDWYYSINRAAARPRYGVARILRRLRQAGNKAMAVKARKRWQNEKRQGDEWRAGCVVLCRWMYHEAARDNAGLHSTEFPRRQKEKPADNKRSRMQARESQPLTVTTESPATRINKPAQRPTLTTRS